MKSWTAGAADITRLVARKHLEQVAGSAADGQFLLDAADTRINSASALADSDPVGAFEMAYEGARHCATALLLQQGLRPRSDGGHIAIIEAVQAQFGGAFDQLSTMRRLRNSLEYPRRPGDLAISTSDAAHSADYARGLHEQCSVLITNLGLWRNV